MNKKWILPPADTERIERLARAMRISRITARMLVNRDLAESQSARRFLEPSLHELKDPSGHPYLTEAASFLCDAIRAGRRITIFGDYDADGICAAAMLVNCLRSLEANVDFHIPQRLDEGYGLNCDAIGELKRRGTEVIVTVDCGICAHSEAAHAASLGMTLLVTDHHEPRGERPPASFVLNPHLPDCDFSYKYLAGVGVAFKLAWALGQAMAGGPSVSDKYKESLMEALPLVAIGTIADMVPLADENRVLAHFGLKMLPHSTNPGVLALIESARVSETTLTARHVAFQLAPRLNAAGRMGDAGAAVEMLTTDDPRHAADLAAHHDEQNRRRQSIQRSISEEAQQRVKSGTDLDQFGCIVLSSSHWHLGVLGLVASRLAQTFWRPAFVLREESGFARGSARSIPGFPLFDAMTRCEDLLERYGGHEAAAGLTIRVENLNPLAERMSEIAQELFGMHPPVPHLDLEGDLRLSDLSPPLMAEIGLLAPFGVGNPDPLFAAKGLSLAGNPQLCGRNRAHLRFLARQDDTTLDVIAFGKADWLKELTSRRDEPFALAFKPAIDTFSGYPAVKLHAEDIQWESEALIERRSAAPA